MVITQSGRKVKVEITGKFKIEIREQLQTVNRDYLKRLSAINPGIIDIFVKRYLV
jgi:hypothetical protein